MMLSIIISYYLELNACLVNLHVIRPTSKEEKLNLCVEIVKRGFYYEIKK